MSAMDWVVVTAMVVTLVVFLRSRRLQRQAARPQRSFCGQEDPNSYFACSRANGHTGDHAVVLWEHTHRWRN